jgi:hypothetical protein
MLTPVAFIENVNPKQGVSYAAVSGSGIHDQGAANRSRNAHQKFQPPQLLL